jgi:hypothetical protein
MYGLVNQAVKSLLVEAGGDALWQKVREHAGAPDDYSPLVPYDDAITYNLVGAASQVLQEPAETLLHQFGVYWVARIATLHYPDMMDTSGTTFALFLRNLDHMHERMRVSFPDYRPPSFRVVELDDAALQVDYYSSREGLIPFVEGLFHGLAAHFGRRLTMTHVADETHGMPCRRMKLQHGPLTP